MRFTCRHRKSNVCDRLRTPGIICPLAECTEYRAREVWCIRIGEHKRHCHLGQYEKSTVAEHALSNKDRNILFDKT